MYMLWIILAIVFLAVEFGTVALISLWFVGGSVAALAVCLLGGPLWLQVLVFGLISLALLLLVRPFLKKYIDPKKVRTNVDAMRGRQAVLLETVDNLAATGSLELSGVVWTARSADGSVIPAGTVVTVQGVEGVKLLVLPVKQ
ncbi:MAG: NfeD family protein [Oscillospiraceae bacterium]|nr:NfeD family protein [Oscillospiraceae bacterium]MBQ1589153.1 NfeD family protein [Oscillospiraceae bacterium]MBQ2144662.1 NfeD family protein [Oscillospiraceae bacterium]MBQ2203221.1 NfeD family protein [Oscillospiraceae bacterium]MBQ5468569.1 NfeD family protein [Oscillospiraceae bacterium]